MSTEKRPGFEEKGRWARRKRARIRNYRYRPLLEALEDRLAPSSFSIIDITLSNHTAPEDTVPAAAVATFTAQGAEDASFQLVNGAGDADNSHFSITENTLRVVVPLDFETQLDYSIRVEASHPGLQSFDKVFTITAVDENDPPFAADFSVSARNGRAIPFLLHGDDGDPAQTQTLTFHLDSPPTHGTIVSFNSTSGRVVYLSALGYVGTDSFTYTLHDSGGADSVAPITVTIGVQPRAQTPTLQVSDASGGEGTPIPLAIAASLNDTDGNEGLSVTIKGVPEGASFSAGTNLGNGLWSFTHDQLAGLTITIPHDGSYTFTVKATATETSNGDQSSVTKLMHLSVANLPLTLATPKSVILEAGKPLNQLIGISDPGNDPLTLTIDFGDGSAVATLHPSPGFIKLGHAFNLPAGVDEKDFFIHFDASDGQTDVFRTMVVHVFSAKQIANLDQFADLLTNGNGPADLGINWSNNAELDAELNAPAGWSLFVAGYKANPTPGNNGPNSSGQSFVNVTDSQGQKSKLQSVGFFDVRASGSQSDSSVQAFISVSFLVSPDQADKIALFAWDGTTWRAATSAAPIQRVVSAPDASGKVTVTLTYLFTAHTFPSVYLMDHTIFTVAVTAPPAPPQTVSISQPAIVVSNGLSAFPPTTVQTTFTSTNQLNLVLQVSQGTDVASRRTEASTIAAADAGGDYQLNLAGFEDVGWIFNNWNPPQLQRPARVPIDAPMPPAAQDAAPAAVQTPPEARENPPESDKSQFNLLDSVFKDEAHETDGAADYAFHLDTFSPTLSATDRATDANAGLALGGLVLGVAAATTSPRKTPRRTRLKVWTAADFGR